MSDLISQLTDHASRANPWPIYAEFRAQRIVQVGERDHAFARYGDVQALLRDPRLSSDGHNLDDPSGQLLVDHPPFIQRDPPSHDSLREATTRQFGPPHSPGVVTAQD